MRVLFIQDNGLNESLALTELSAYLKSLGHETDLLIERDERDLMGAALNPRPDVFVVPCDILGSYWAIKTVRRLKSRFQAPVILCGTHPLLYPEIIQRPEVDILCRGEIESAMGELLRRIEAGESIKDAPNVWYKDSDGAIYRNDFAPLLENLDSLPIPDREIYYKYPYLRDVSTKRFATGRGCPHHCAFCFNPIFKEIYKGKGRYVRKKSPRRVVDEINYIKARYPLRHVHFSDDLFTVSGSWIAEFADVFPSEVGLSFTCNVSADMIDETIAHNLKRAGCGGIAMGLESGVEEIRKRILNKDLTNDDYLRAAGWIKEQGIRLLTFNIIGIPGETVEDVFETIEFNRKLKSDYQRVFMAFPLPGTSMAKSTSKQGYLAEDKIDESALIEYLERYKFSAHSVFNLPRKNEFINLLYFFRTAVRLPWLEKLIKLLIKVPNNFLYRLETLAVAYQEKKFFHVSWISGLRFFLHTGNPNQKTKNFNNYIP